jgi:hypothetical protein
MSRSLSRSKTVAVAGAVLAGALWWRKHPSACPYAQRFWSSRTTVAAGRHLITGHDRADPIASLLIAPPMLRSGYTVVDGTRRERSPGFNGPRRRVRGPNRRQKNAICGHLAENRPSGPASKKPLSCKGFVLGSRASCDCLKIVVTSVRAWTRSGRAKGTLQPCHPATRRGTRNATRMRPRACGEVLRR